MISARTKWIAVPLALAAIAVSLWLAGALSLRETPAGSPAGGLADVEAGSDIDDAGSDSSALPESADDPQQPSSAARTRLPSGPHGIVVDQATDQPIEGLTVQSRFGTKVLVETTTRADGTFELPRSERSARTVEVVSEDWRISPRRQRLDEDQSAGRTELLFRAERIIAAPLRGRLVDRETGEPIPEFLIRAEGPVREDQEIGSDRGEGTPTARVTFQFPPRRTEDITTGSDGRFQSRGEFEAGTLALALFDHPAYLNGDSPEGGWMIIEHRHVFGSDLDAEWDEVLALVGPTYRIDLDLPAGMLPEDFHATFPLASEGALRGIHEVAAEDPTSPFARFYGQALAPGGLEPWAPLRAGDPIWTRFRSPVVLMEADEESGGHDLHIRSLDGHWAGEARVASVAGIHPGSVRVELTHRGVLQGVVRSAGGDPVQTAWVQMIDPRNPDLPLREVGASGEGAFEFRWLDPGEYRVRVRTSRYREWAALVSIGPGTTEDLEVRLEADAPLGTVSGVLRSRTGRHRAKGATVTLQSLADPELHLFKSAYYRKRDGRYEARFSFQEVPEASYTLSIRPLDNMPWNPRSMVVSAPAEGLEFICEDEAPSFDFAFRALDRESGGPLETTDSIVWQGDPLDDVRLDEDWESDLYEGVSEAVPLRWILRAEGYRLARGEESAFQQEGEIRVAEVRLDRGWGQVFVVTTRDRTPIEGVELLVDGDSAGRTDRRGLVVVDRAATPKVLEFRYDGWHVSWGRVDPSEPDFGSGLETPVYLSRDE